MPKISVIIPVYNSEKYLSETLDSVLSQVFTDFEVVCIDDGSKDSSLKILKKYAKQDKRIKVLTQKHSGSAVAKNNAIKQSSGEYIFILDSNDFVDTHTLEKMYEAIVSGKGDIITCRVKMLGLASGEMFFKKTNKINMSVDNCLANSALFKKSDFDKSGGFDKNYDKGSEYYDLWLNMIFNLNKKIYRLRDILLFCRITSKKKNKSENLINGFYKKYPKMRLYKILNKYDAFVKKLQKFIFKNENHKIKIFNIPVYTTRKYDSVMSMGPTCFVAEALINAHVRDFSGTFDWMGGYDVVKKIQIVENKYKDYFNMEDFEYNGVNPDNGKMVYTNKRTGILYNHDFPAGKLKDVFPEVAEKYQRRIKRVLYHLNNDKKFLLVFAEIGHSADINEIVKAMEKLNKKFPAKIDLLYINHNPNIKLGKHTKIKRVSDNVLYAEYYYEKYPEETRQARHICKKLVKKIAR